MDTPLGGAGGRDADLEVADTIGRLMHFWGFKRPMGRIWTVLYLSPEALPAVELAQRLKMSAGAVSMALGELEKWGAVSRSWVPGERRDYFSAEPSIWKMVQRVLRDRELVLVREFQGSLERASQAVGSESSYKRARLGELAALCATGASLLEALVSGGTVDPTLLVHPEKRSLDP
jgi:DNA-binding transcriptional regulator GbsR (MarR family)